MSQPPGYTAYEQQSYPPHHPGYPPLQPGYAPQQQMPYGVQPGYPQMAPQVVVQPVVVAHAPAGVLPPAEMRPPPLMTMDGRCDHFCGSTNSLHGMIRRDWNTHEVVCIWGALTLSFRKEDPVYILFPFSVHQWTRAQRRMCSSEHKYLCLSDASCCMPCGVLAQAHTSVSFPALAGSSTVVGCPTLPRPQAPCQPPAHGHVSRVSRSPRRPAPVPRHPPLHRRGVLPPRRGLRLQREQRAASVRARPARGHSGGVEPLHAGEYSACSRAHHAVNTR